MKRPEMQPQLFDAPQDEADVAREMARRRPGFARHGQPDSAWDAAVHIAADAAGLRFRVLAAFVAAGDEGLTNLEVEASLGLRRPTGSNRRLELEQHALVAKVTGAKRTLGTSEPAQVYRITPLGLAVHRHVQEQQA